MGNTISPNTHLFAAYVGLTISGYDMADDRDLEIQELIRKVRSLHWRPEIARYFAVARTGGVKVNPYWPRGSMLSTASLHIGPDHRFAQADQRELERVFLQAENIGPEDKAPDLLAWVMRLPEMVVIIMEHPAYAELWNSYLTIIQQRCAKWEDLVQGSLTSVTKTLCVDQVMLPSVRFVPNLLQSPYLADYAIKGNTLYVIRTTPDAISIVHELLHSLFDQSVRQAVGTLNLDYCSQWVDLVRMQSLGYAWDSSRESLTRILQESYVRAASIWVVCGNDLERADRLCQDYVDQGFSLVPSLLYTLHNSWQGLSSIGNLVADAITNQGSDLSE